MIYIIILLLLVLAFVLGMYTNVDRDRRRQAERADEFEGLFVEISSDFIALDQGMTEVQDAYTTDMAAYEESIEAGFNQNQHLQGVLTQALDKITLLEKDIEDAQQMALDFQLVVTTHDAVCLPTLP